MLTISRSVLADPDAAFSHEWLVTNGIGGYASSTVLGANTRRYHGLLVASFSPPLERQVVLSKVDEELLVGGQLFQLGTNEYHDGTIHPKGYLFLKSFRLDLGIPEFEYSAAGVTLIKRVWMEYGNDTVHLLYRLSGDRDVELRIRPFCVFRGYHHPGQRKGRDVFTARGDHPAVIVESEHAPYSLKLAVTPGATFQPGADWYYGYMYRAERERGFDCLEDLFTPGQFMVHVKPGQSAGLIATCEKNIPDVSIDTAFRREKKRRRALVDSEDDPLRRQLLLAADQFIVRPASGRNCERRLSPAESRPLRNPMHPASETSILAGYHWFTDWGRDTMISLPGLLLCTGRYDDARDILLRYIQWIDGGMIPNRFTDEGSVEYNTADATLWYFQALRAYIAASGDRDIIGHLFPALSEIIECHLKGTRFGIRTDASDGLLFAGRNGSQVTWMDACVDGCPVTPRVGKPVEVNALWYNALNLMASWAMQVGSSPGAYERLAEKCAVSFGRRFWYARGGYLYDVIDGPNGDDSSLRPNQILAVSLPYSPLHSTQQKQVVDAVERSLLTPYGLRSLSPDHPAYAGAYIGGPAERDAVYHQGTAWPWLLGQFADAHYRVYRDRARIASLLEPFRSHIAEAGLGSISEIFDGDFPHKPGGAIAQAWSVAEILRVSTNLRSMP